MKTGPLTPSEIERYFHEKIPLTRAMGVRVISWDRQALLLEAPLSENHNHLGTAFGGSLSALAILAGYGVLWLELDDAAAHGVIRRGNLDFFRPVTGDLRARCALPPAALVESFRQSFRRSGKARITLETTMEADGQPAARFTGEYAAIRAPES